MKPNIRRGVIVVCGILFLGSFFFLIPHINPIFATTYYVAGDTGSDTNDGSESSPWATIQQAADTMVAGDTVNVKGGVTYAESVVPANSGTSGNTITYQAWPGTGMPFFNANGVGDTLDFTAKNYLIFDGFKLTSQVKIVDMAGADNIY